MFERPHHRRVAEALSALDADLLDEARCFFGGGTAIVLALGEYRESVDIDLPRAPRRRATASFARGSGAAASRG